MAKVDDQIRGLEFTTTTSATGDAIQTAVRRAAEAAKLMGGNGKMKEIGLTEADGGHGLIFAVLMGVGVENARVAVRWSLKGDGKTSVRLEVLSASTRQEKLLMVIPAGPKRMPALRCLRRFKDALVTELAAAGASA